MNDASTKILNTVRYLVLGAGILVCFFVLLRGGFDPSTFARLAEVLGPVLLVTFLVLGFLQELQRRVFATLIFKTVLGDHVTPEAIELFRREIGDNALVRPKSKWSFRFEDKGSAMELDLKIESLLVNVAPKPREHLSPQLNGSKGEHVRFTSYMFGASSAQSQTVYDFDGNPPPKTFTVAAHETYEEELNVAGTYSKDSVFDQHHTRTFIGSLEIEFVYPKGYSVEVAHHFSSKPRGGEIVRLYKKDSKDWDHERRVWRVDTVLPQQGISFRVNKP